MKHNELWQNIPGYEAYYKVSNKGRVKSLKRIVPHPTSGKRTIKERILKSAILKNRPHVVLKKDGKTKLISIHQLMAMAFLNHQPNGHKIIVDHIDNNPLNNNLDNLQLISQRKNTSKDKKPKSGYTGVYKHGNKWRAVIYKNGKLNRIGTFDTPLKASKEYQKHLSRV